MTNPQPQVAETATDLRRRAARAWRLVREMGSDQDARRRMEELAGALEAQAARLERVGNVESDDAF
jgi:hypothetical protein